MELKYNLTGERRKSLVTELGKILLWEPVYKKAPTFEYVVGNYKVDRDGTITCPECATPEIVRQIMEKLNELGYTPSEMPDFSASDLPAEDHTENTPALTNPSLEEKVPSVSEGAPEYHPDHLVIDIPRSYMDDDAINRLRLLIDSKASLFKKVFQTDDLSVIVAEEQIRFPWFTLTGDPSETDTYTKFVSALCKTAREQKHVRAKERDQDNDKFTFRLFLIRLGFIGDEYKAARKFLLRNLTGNSSWKSGHAPDKRCDQSSVAEAAALPAVVLTAPNPVEPVSSDTKEGDSTL